MMEEYIIGQLDAIFYENPSNLYKVIRIQVEDSGSHLFSDDSIILTGQFPSLRFETSYQFYGQFVTHPKYGEQFAVSRYQAKEHASAKSLVQYLSSRIFTGIGSKTAENIVGALGTSAIDQILENPDVLDTIQGFPKKRKDSFIKILQEQEGTERIYLQLTQWGFTMGLAEKIFKTYEFSTLDLLQENPYRLVLDIEGIGFVRADQMAEAMGFEPDSKFRILAALYWVLREVSYQNGDTYMTQEECKEAARLLLEKARNFLIEDNLLEEALDLAILQERIIQIEDLVLLPSLFYAEKGIADSLKRIFDLQSTTYFEPEKLDAALEEISQKNEISYDQVQLKAMKIAINHPISIITGGPGTGKTTLVKGIIDLHLTLEDETNHDILLAAPTGRAAKRLSEMTGRPASTIHRLLGFTMENDGQADPFMAEERELEGSLLIIDEMSMVDTWLMNLLLKAIPYQMKIILVGDQDQLPSVGPGKVFADFIQSNIIQTIRLEKIYRQENESSIIDLAHTIRLGQVPSNLMDRKVDRSFIPCQDDQVIEVVSQIVERASNKDFTLQDFQVLAPMYKGQAGINRLNQALQSRLNPSQAGRREIEHFASVYRVGDKVLQLVNDSERDVYNGDMGIISAIFKDDETESGQEEIIVRFDDKELTYKKTELDQITLAYACSIHKAQGSEYPLIILPMVKSYGRMLRKNLLYTAVTRAKSRLVLVGNPNSFAHAIQTEERERNTLLPDLLHHHFDGTMSQNKETELAEKSDKQLNSTHILLDMEKKAFLHKEEREQVSSEVLFQLNEQSRQDEIQEGDTYQLTKKNIDLIDPMIGMDGVNPYEMKKQKY